MRRKAKTDDQVLEDHAETMRRAHQTGDRRHQSEAVEAQHELQQPEHAKGRPPGTRGSSNAGNDGGA